MDSGKLPPIAATTTAATTADDDAAAAERKIILPGVDDICPASDSDGRKVSIDARINSNQLQRGGQSLSRDDASSGRAMSNNYTSQSAMTKWTSGYGTYTIYNAQEGASIGSQVSSGFQSHQHHHHQQQQQQQQQQQWQYGGSFSGMSGYLPSQSQPRGQPWPLGASGASNSESGLSQRSGLSDPTNSNTAGGSIRSSAQFNSNTSSGGSAKSLNQVPLQQQQQQQGFIVYPNPGNQPVQHSHQQIHRPHPIQHGYVPAARAPMQNPQHHPHHHHHHQHQYSLQQQHHQYQQQMFTQSPLDHGVNASEPTNINSAQMGRSQQHMERQQHQQQQQHSRYQDSSSLSSMLSNRRTRENLPKHVTQALKSWLFNNQQNPYPKESQKRDLCKQLGLTPTQLNNWFINARRRYLKKSTADQQSSSQDQGSRSSYETMPEADASASDSYNASPSDVQSPLKASLNDNGGAEMVYPSSDGQDTAAEDESSVEDTAGQVEQTSSSESVSGSAQNSMSGNEWQQQLQESQQKVPQTQQGDQRVAVKQSQAQVENADTTDSNEAHNERQSHLDLILVAATLSNQMHKFDQPN
ncbi:hypothetical protein MP228_012945 [Amoeboaphelidium protococcarum]|nr:hypothetical protein MP228_012945 [Amoeboaphelidium protococcarum]